MQVDIALCQIRPMTGSPEMNAETVANMLVSRDEEVLIFPESFLTGYGVSPEGLEERISAALTTISDTCRKYDKAVAVGTPMPGPEGWTNSLAFRFPAIAWLTGVDVQSSVSLQADRLTQTRLVSPQRYALAPTTDKAGEHDASILFARRYVGSQGRSYAPVCELENIKDVAGAQRALNAMLRNESN